MRLARLTAALINSAFWTRWPRSPPMPSTGRAMTIGWKSPLTRSSSSEISRDAQHRCPELAAILSVRSGKRLAGCRRIPMSPYRCSAMRFLRRATDPLGAPPLIARAWPRGRAQVLGPTCRLRRMQEIFFPFVMSSDQMPASEAKISNREPSVATPIPWLSSH